MVLLILNVIRNSEHFTVPGYRDPLVCFGLLCQQFKPVTVYCGALPESRRV